MFTRVKSMPKKWHTFGHTLNGTLLYSHGIYKTEGHTLSTYFIYTYF